MAPPLLPARAAKICCRTIRQHAMRDMLLRALPKMLVDADDAIAAARQPEFAALPIH